MAKIEKELIDMAIALHHKVKDFIKSKEDWVFYFLDPRYEDRGNVALYKAVEENPNDWSSDISFEVASIGTSTVTVIITIDDGCSEPMTLQRSIYIPTFGEQIERNKKLYGATLRDLKKKELESDIVRAKERLHNLEKELEGIKKKEEEEKKNDR